MVDFNKKVDRYNTFCTQWDYIKDRFGRDDLLPFTISDMDLESPDEIIDIIRKRTDHKVFGYSRWNHDPYKESIVEWYKKRFNTIINKDWIVYSPSVIYSISKFIEIWSEKGDGVLINTPAYDGFYKVIEANDRKIVKSSLVIENGRSCIDFNDFEEKCKIAKIFLLCNPHNPTGRVWTEEELIRIIEICKKNNVKIISDDIHMDITYKRKCLPILKLENSEEIIICSSPSKTFNIPALTGSYIIIPCRLEREKFLNILKNKDALSSPAIFSVLATIEAYKNCDYWVDELTKYTMDNMILVKEYIKENIRELSLEIPEGTYFAMINFKNLGVSSDEFQKALIEYGKVAIMPGKTYGEEGEYFIRLNTACSRKKVIEGLDRIKMAVDSLK